MTKSNLLVFEDAEALYASAASSLAQLAQAAVAARGRFLLVLSGGSTPLPLFKQLAGPPYSEEIPWEQSHIFWGDERMVPPTDEGSNFGQAREHLLQHVPVPEEQIYRIAGEMDPAAAAQAYTQVLGAVAGPGHAWPRFDLVLLGMGEDGHTASLFPGSAHPLPERAPTVAAWGQYGTSPAARVTLTPPALNSAREIFFLVTGATKASALAAVLAGEGDAVSWPARRIWPEDGHLTWFVDRAAAELLPGAKT